MSTPSALPTGARLLHVGPHKTGTTALQSAFHQARSDAAQQGVRYLSRSQHDARAARYVTDRMVAGRDPARAAKAWRAVVEGFTAPGPERRVFSSEFLSDATDEQVARIIGELGSEDLWVAITLRPLARILSSQYQQGLQRQSPHTYDAWLRMVLAEDVSAPEPREFWNRHRHDALARRWAGHVGPERVVVIVLDPRDHAFLPHAFERLLGLRPETLAGQDARENRSLSADEAELLRRFNASYAGLGLQPDHYVRLFRHLKDHLKEREPGPDEASLVTPDWAVDRANAIGAAMASTIRDLGVQVYGDLDSISATPTSGVSATPEPPTTVDAGVAAWFGAGLALAAQRLATPGDAAPGPAAGVPPKGLRGRLSRRG
ncbi:hypothetical protein ACFFOS_08360 [Nocardioides kongjuensis]|uniref:Sulfotransferase family protein n=1 Tax=Nocardioides kongjuensis TaxID=349522 RepID=A0A852RVS1_9ACTN|nr:hypothetical protein [Nocardioides kongjuensis]NYD32970.1 hypothetical protein [Nocardioides kongjuensis]